MVAALTSDAPFTPAQAQQPQDSLSLGHAQLVHGVVFETTPWHAQARSAAAVHFHMPTDPWYIFNCAQVVHFACPPRIIRPYLNSLSGALIGYLLHHDRELFQGALDPGFEFEEPAVLLLPVIDSNVAMRVYGVKPEPTGVAAI